jgi:hypothetical protein
VTALWIAWRKLASLRDPERVCPWLLAVAANEARAILRQRHRHPVVELTIAADDPADDDPADEIGQVDLSNALRRASSRPSICTLDFVEVQRLLYSALDAQGTPSRSTSCRDPPTPT